MISYLRLMWNFVSAFSRVIWWMSGKLLTKNTNWNELFADTLFNIITKWIRANIRVKATYCMAHSYMAIIMLNGCYVLIFCNVYVSVFVSLDFYWTMNTLLCLYWTMNTWICLYWTMNTWPCLYWTMNTWICLYWTMNTWLCLYWTMNTWLCLYWTINTLLCLYWTMNNWLFEWYLGIFYSITLYEILLTAGLFLHILFTFSHGFKRRSWWSKTKKWWVIALCFCSCYYPRDIRIKKFHQKTTFNI